jgi:hypothetical protein
MAIYTDPFQSVDSDRYDIWDDSLRLNTFKALSCHFECYDVAHLLRAAGIVQSRNLLGDFTLLVVHLIYNMGISDGKALVCMRMLADGNGAPYSYPCGVGCGGITADVEFLWLVEIGDVEFVFAGVERQNSEYGYNVC